MRELKKICKTLIYKKKKSSQDLPTLHDAELESLAVEVFLSSLLKYNSDVKCTFKTYLYGNIWRKYWTYTRDIERKPKMRAWTQEVTAKFPVTDVFGDKRQELNEALDVYLKQKFEPYGIVIDTVNFTNIVTDSETSAAIQRKVTAQQELELANIEAKTAKVQADKDKEVALIAAEQEKEKATIEAEQKKIQAEGEAEATRIKAEAEAEANKKIAESLTPELIEKQKIEKWSGDVPQVQGSNTPIVSIGE